MHSRLPSRDNKVISYNFVRVVESEKKIALNVFCIDLNLETFYILTSKIPYSRTSLWLIWRFLGQSFNIIHTQPAKIYSYNYTDNCLFNSIALLFLCNWIDWGLPFPSIVHSFHKRWKEQSKIQSTKYLWWRGRFLIDVCVCTFCVQIHRKSFQKKNIDDEQCIIYVVPSRFELTHIGFASRSAQYNKQREEKTFNEWMNE